MALWQFAIGNAVQRAAASPVAALSSAEDALFGLSYLGNGLTDEPARWARNASAIYGADVDLNQLAASSSRADAPTGWFDFLNLVEGTPGLPGDPPDFGDHGGRNPSLQFFRPVAQDVDVMPGEVVTVEGGLYLPSGSSATAVRLRVIDLFTGRSYDGTTNAWLDGDYYIAEQTSTDAWLDFAELIAADVDRTERAAYRVLLEQDAASYDSASFVYASANGAAGNPALFPSIGFAAIFGHNLPADATVSVQESGGGGSPIALTPLVPSFFGSASAQAFRSWRLSITMPAGSESYHERPYIGELWLSQVADMTWCPAFPFELTVEDPGQIRSDGGYGRVYVTSDAPRELHGLKLNFKTNGDDGYQQIRRSVMQATRQGADPLVLVPVSTLEGVVAYHGRMANAVAYARRNNTRREFVVPFQETPFPRVP